LDSGLGVCYWGEKKAVQKANHSRGAMSCTLTEIPWLRSEEKDGKEGGGVKGRRQSLPAPHQAKALPNSPGWSKHYQHKKSVESLGKC